MYKAFLKIFYSAPLLILFGLAGCLPGSYVDTGTIERQGEDFKAISRSRAVTVTEEPYLGAKLTPRQTSSLPLANTRVTLRQKGTLAELCRAVEDLVPLAVHVSGMSGESPEEPAGEPAGKPEDLLTLPERPGSGRVSVSYEGMLSGLLDQLAERSGYGWEYSPERHAVIFSRIQMRTFTIMGAPGKVRYENQITNKSKETAAASMGSGSGVGQTVSTADTSAQTSQSNVTELEFDIWAEALAEVKSLLSKQGSVTANQAAGTLTVRDAAPHLRRIAGYIEELNGRLSRQVALTAHVWALEVTDEVDAGLNLQGIFQSGSSLALAANGISIGDAGSLSATILDGKLKDSALILQALRQWGEATVVTSSGGIAMSNQPFPVMAIKRQAYLAGVSTTTNSEYGQTAQLTPGEVTTGFAMTLIPHILDRRRVILQYNVNLSSLDDLREFSTAGVTVQFPQVSTRSFSQRMTMKMGQTLVLAGFEQSKQDAGNTVGLFGLGRAGGGGRTLLVVTIEVESAGV